MDKDTRNAIDRATQRARRLLEDDFAVQLEGDFDVLESGAVGATPSKHLSPRQVYARHKIVAAIEHKRASGLEPAAAVADYRRDAAFTTLNRFVALKMLEARDLVLPCLTKGEQSSGYAEFCGMSAGVKLLPDGQGYRLYLECIFDELSTEVKVLFDRRDPASVLWPKRATFLALLEILNAPELASVWGEDETIGWVYQYFNSGDERRAMRDASQAPRNSRELAVRNQFFTPRYVVQFLTDNTLGRIWYEMRGGDTALRERCEYLVRKPDETYDARAKKDPRDLRVLDPACGSGHFLLYAFDLLATIYAEGWVDPDAPKSEATGRTLAADYPTEAALNKATPALVLAHNLHGVDIDARCAQIAQLALWMRAQRAYKDAGIGRAERPIIRRANIVVAEPLVADDATVEAFVEALGDIELGRVFTGLVDALKLAGDLGLLLRVEKLVERAPAKGKTGDLFAPAEERIRATLVRFVAAADEAGSTRRRLFADDAVQGMGLLETAEKKYDVMLMNPPFGAGSIRAKKDFDAAYPRTKNDVYAAFVERRVELLVSRGRLGAISSRTAFFLSSFQKWREITISRDAPPAVFADLGAGVLDSAMVETAAYCLEVGLPNTSRPATFFRVLQAAVDCKSMALATAVAELRARQPQTSTAQHDVFERNVSSFSAVPGAPFAYWASESVQRVFQRLQPLEASGRVVKQGIATRDDFRLVRAWWEIECTGPSIHATWPPFAKGGAFSAFYADVALVVRWDAEAQASYVERTSNFNVLLTSSRAEFLYRPGLTWPRRTNGLSFRAMARGCIFADKGPAVFVPEDAPDMLLSLAAIVNSRAFGYLMAVQLARTELAQSYEVGLVQQTPIPQLDTATTERLSPIARRAWSLKRSLDLVNEVSHAFLLPQRARTMSIEEESIRQELLRIQAELDDCVFALYGIGIEDRATIETSARAGKIDAASLDRDPDENDIGEEDSDESGLDATSGIEVAAQCDMLTSWYVGVAFGRFDVRLATGERQPPPDPEPFDPLPTRSPGMWPESEPRDVEPPAILVDDPGHRLDLTNAVAAVAERIGADEPDKLRGRLAKEFFPLHIKMYSKSRRKAPIYWQLATPTASYSVWLYLHAFTKDTLFHVQELVTAKVEHEERVLERLRSEQERDGSTSASRRTLAAQESFVDELRGMLEEVKRVKPLWQPDLDDGVVINFAPLWRLVPHHKPWQKELRTTWDSLVAGEYDWSRLAMHLWPERVVPKCATDRSLAIAHGLEEVFWLEDDAGKWKPRARPTRPVAELVAERTSIAVQAARDSLLTAASPGGGGSGKARRKHPTGPRSRR